MISRLADIIINSIKGFEGTKFYQNLHKMTPAQDIKEDNYGILDSTIFIAITGAFNPPSFVKHEKRNRDRNTYLKGVTQDILKIKNEFQQINGIELFILENSGASCSLVKEHIISAIQARPNSNVILYYSGHGAYDGSWCLSDGTLTPNELRHFLNNKGVTKTISMIISDSCFSGKFCKESVICNLSKVGHASSYLEKVSYDSDEGGAYTRWLFGEIGCPLNQSPESYRKDPKGQSHWISLSMNPPWKK